MPTDELRDYCVDNRIGFGYYQEEKRSRTTVNMDITEESDGKMNLYLSSLVFPSAYSIVITGASGIGKTTYAIKHAPKPSLLVSHIDQLRRFRPGHHKSIIFDDIDFSEQHIGKQIQLVDSDLPRAIHVRYGVVEIPSKTVKIFTCNEFPFAEHEAIRRRIKFIKA